MACFSLAMELVLEYGSGQNQLPRPDALHHFITIFIIIYFVLIILIFVILLERSFVALSLLEKLQVREKTILGSWWNV